MEKAEIIYLGKNADKDYCGEGAYGLEFNGSIIGTHFCSNRDFANHDLTIWQMENLNNFNVDTVYSNGVIVWQRNNEEINKITQDKFVVANMRYENEHCNGPWVF